MSARTRPQRREARVLPADYEPSAWLRSVEAAADELDALITDAPDGAVAVISCNKLLQRGGDGTCDRCRGPIAGGVPHMAVSVHGHLAVVLGLCGACSHAEGWV